MTGGGKTQSVWSSLDSTVRDHERSRTHVELGHNRPWTKRTTDKTDHVKDKTDHVKDKTEHVLGQNGPCIGQTRPFDLNIFGLKLN